MHKNKFTQNISELYDDDHLGPVTLCHWPQVKGEPKFFNFVLFTIEVYFYKIDTLIDKIFIIHVENPHVDRGVEIGGWS